LGGAISKVFVYATGGLGNQLFQLAAGYSIHAGREIVCEVGFSGPREKLHGTRLLGNISLGGRITLKSSKKFKPVTQRILDYLLRVSTKITGLESLKVYRAILSCFGSLYFSFYYKCFLIISLSKGVGFHNLPKYKSNQMIIGYFQSYRYLEVQDRLSFLSMLTLKTTGPDWVYWSKRAIQEKPIVVHIRLGDYLLESGFGIVSTTYISNALSRLKSEGDKPPIWVFTDQENVATKIFPPEHAADVTWVPEIDSDPMATLSIMRLGSGYIIANSTFSWWAAWSREILEAPVVCPDPWFVALETPQDLIPNDWIQIDSNHDERK
jgi:hypothetical protein